LLHGDDRVREGFYSHVERFLKDHPQVGAVYCRFAYVDENGRFMYNHQQEQEHEGVLDNFVSTLAVRQRIQYAAMVVKREVYEHLGGFYGVEYGEDWEMWMRIAFHYPIGYIPEVLAEYRKHFGSISGRSVLTGKNMRELQEVMQRIEPLVPEEERKKIGRSSRKFYAHYALRTANQIWTGLKDSTGVKAQIREAWRMYKDVGLVYKILKLYTKMTLNL
jgi:hypothetical protein